MKNKKMTWAELVSILDKDHSKVGVVVFKQHPHWEREYSEEDRSYIVHGDNKYFYNNMISRSIWADNLTKTDVGVRLDWYMIDESQENRWQVDYCYLLEECE